MISGSPSASSSGTAVTMQVRSSPSPRTAPISSTRIRRPLSLALQPTQPSAHTSSLNSSKHRAPPATRSASARPRRPVSAWYAGL